MKIVGQYSHLNGLEFLLVHHPSLWKEIQQVISSVNANMCRTKRSKEKTKKGQILYSPIEMNKEMQKGFESRGWTQRRQTLWVTADEKIVRAGVSREADEQKRLIEDAGLKPIQTYNQTDFVKNRVAVEVQFGKYAFVAHDLFVKHMAFFVADVTDVGVEILPMKELESEMSSGVPYYERDLLNIIRQGRGVPAVPLVLIGIAP